MATLFRPIKAGSTDVSIVLTILDSTTGLKKTDVVYNSAGIALSYRRDGATTTAITEATLANAGSAHADGGFVHIGDGEYRLDLPDAACATGVNGVLVHGAVTGGVIQAIYVPLVRVDFSATVTSIPEFGIIDIGTLQSADASGAVIRSGATFANDLIIGSTFVATAGTGYGQARIIYDNALTGDAISISPNWVTTLDNTTEYVILASPPAPTNSAVLPSVSLGAIAGDAQSATDLKDFADAGYDPATNKVQGVVLVDTISAYTGNTPQTGDAYARIGAPVGASISADVAAVKSDTAATLVDTNELQTDWTDGGRLDLLLDATLADTNELQTDWVNGGRLDLILDATATASALATVDGIADTLVAGVITGAAATGTLSTTQATTNLTGYANDQLIGRVIIWLTGNCEGEATDITDYASASGLITFTALTTAPANGDTFKIV